MHKMTEIKQPARVITGAIGSALLIVATGSVPWFVLMHINIRHARSIPWAGLLMLAYLWFFWRYLGGRIGPLASRSWRRESASEFNCAVLVALGFNCRRPRHGQHRRNGTDFWTAA
jgi:hypothetical protein